MSNFMVLRTDMKNISFFPKVKVFSLESGSVCIMNRRVSCLKKIARHYSEENILISHQCCNDRIFSGKKKKAVSLSQNTVLPVLERVCRQTAGKFACKLPFRTVFVVAEPLTACKIISLLRNIAHLFVVVSTKQPAGSLYDELYFQYGIMIQHMPYINNDEDSIIIKCNDDVELIGGKAPVVDFTGLAAGGSNVINLHKVHIKDSTMCQTQRIWGGKSSLVLFELLGIVPNNNSIIDINNCADDIFLLDTGAV